jgi:hypothetical protein
MGFPFPVVDVQSFNHDAKNVNVVRRGFRCSIIVICHARVSMLALDQAEYPDQDKGAYDGIAHGGACVVVRDHAVVCSALVDHHCQCQPVQHTLQWSTLLGSL